MSWSIRSIRVLSQAVEEKLRGIEDAMIGEALELVRDGAGDESDLRAINAGVASRLDAAYDLESVRQSLGHLEATLDTMRRREDGDDAGQPEDVDDGPQGSWAQLVDKGEGHSESRFLHTAIFVHLRMDKTHCKEADASV